MHSAAARSSSINHVAMTRPPGSPSDSFILRFEQIARRSRKGVVDRELRILDVVLSASFLLVALPISLLILLTLLTTSGRPIFYRGERVGRGGRLFTMLKFRTLRPGAERRLGPWLGPELVERTR